MKKSAITGMAALTCALVGASHADVKTTPAAASAQPAKPRLQIVSGAKALSNTEKADVTGMCGCECPAPPPAPTPDPVAKAKPGYGFGAKTEHYGPPGQGFTPSNTWRNARDAGVGTPKGNSLPPRAFK